MTELRPTDVARMMLAIEGAVSEEADMDIVPVDRAIATWLGIEYEGLDEVLLTEVRRAVVLARDYYVNAAPGDPGQALAVTAFMQGITFAVAAQRLREEQHA